MSNQPDYNNADFIADLHRIRRMLADAMTARERNQVKSVEPPAPSLPPRPVAKEVHEVSPPKPANSPVRPPLFGSIVESAMPFGGSVTTPLENKIVKDKVVHEVDIAADSDEYYEQTDDILLASTEFYADTLPTTNNNNDSNSDIVIHRPSPTYIHQETVWLERISFIMFVFGWLGIVAGLLLIVFNGGQKDALLFDIGLRGICFGLGMVIVRMIGVSMLADVPPQRTVAQS